MIGTDERFSIKKINFRFVLFRPPRLDQFTPGANYGMFYDLGVYGTPGPVKRRQKYDAVEAMRAMEKWVFPIGISDRKINFQKLNFQIHTRRGWLPIPLCRHIYEPRRIRGNVRFNGL